MIFSDTADTIDDIKGAHIALLIVGGEFLLKKGSLKSLIIFYGVWQA